MHVIGIDLGGTNIKAALVHKAFGLVKTNSVETGAEEGKDHVLAQIEAAVKPLMKHRGRIHGIGIGAPGSIDLDRKTLIHPPNMPGWGVCEPARCPQETLGKAL